MYFSELAKEIKKECGRDANVELIVVGGASILLNYDFRESTIDVDALVSSRISIKESINRVGDKYGLPNGWINSDFKTTNSFSPKLVQFSKYYKTFNQSLTVRTVESEYLIAMKLASLRKYKYDRSDIVGILQANKDTNPISFKKIDKAVIELYGTWERLPVDAKDIVQKTISQIDDKELYLLTLKEETFNKELLINFEIDYENVLKEDNIDAILNSLQMKEKQLINDKTSIKRLAQKEQRQERNSNKKPYSQRVQEGKDKAAEHNG